MKSIICIILFTVLTLLILNIKNREGFNENNLSGKWNGTGLDSGPIIFEHNGNVINANYPNIGEIVAIIDDKKITWRTKKTGVIVLGELISDKDGKINTIKWQNGLTWNRVLEEEREHDLPDISVPNLSGNWWSPNMTHGSIKLTQKDNKVQGSYEKLGNGNGTIVNNRIIWIWGNSSVKTIGEIIMKNNKAIEIRWQNGFVWKLIQPAANVAGKWTGSGLTSGPLIMLQNNNVVNAVYSGYGPMTGEIINNRIQVKWIFSGAEIGGTVIKDKNNLVEKIRCDNNLEWYFGEKKAKPNQPTQPKQHTMSNKSNPPNPPDQPKQPNQSNKPNQPNKSNQSNQLKKVDNNSDESSNKPFLNLNLKEIGMSLGDIFTTPLPTANLKDPYPILTGKKESFVNLDNFISRGPAHIIR